MQIPLGGQQARYAELARRLDEYLSGAIQTIPELGANLPQVPSGDLGCNSYHWLATPSSIL